MVAEIHQQFIKVVKEGRGKRLKETPDMFSGLIWSGAKSVELGLADGFGGLDYVARDVIKAEEIIDYTPRENLAERERRIASATSRTASSCPTTRSCRRSSIFSSLSRSPCIILDTGMPVARETTSAISSAPGGTGPASVFSTSANASPYRPAAAAASAGPASAACGRVGEASGLQDRAFVRRFSRLTHGTLCLSPVYIR